METVERPAWGDAIPGTILLDQGLAGSQSSSGRFGGVRFFEPAIYVFVDWEGFVIFARDRVNGGFWFSDSFGGS